MKAKHASSATPADAPQPRERVRVRVRNKRRHRWYRRKLIRRRILVGLGFLGFLLLADGVWAAIGVVSGLDGARTHLQAGAKALFDGKLTVAEEAFDEAGREAGGAAASLLHPAAWLADAIPGVGNEVDALQGIAASGVEVATTGQRLVDAAKASGWDGRSIPGLEATDVEAEVGEDAPPEGQPQEVGEQGGRGDRDDRGGRVETGGRDRSRTRGPQVVQGSGGVKVDVDVLREAAPHLRAAAGAITRAEGHLRAVDPSGLWYPVARALQEARSTLGDRGGLIRRIADLSEFLPGFLGSGESRRYLLTFQNLSAPRGSGGFLGIYGILSAEDGKLKLLRMAGVKELDGAEEPVDAPSAYLDRYRRFGGATEIFAANYSPDFPTTGRVLLDIYEAAEGQRLDGVIAVDPVWVAYVLEASGPVHTPAWPEAVSAQNASRILHHDVFLLDKQASDETQIALGAALIEGLLKAPLDPGGLADALSRAARERHLQMYADRPAEQDLIEDLGADGAFRPGDNPLAVVWQDATNNKAGYFARRSATHRVEIRPDGSAAVSTRVTLYNTAPPGPPSVLLGSGTSGDPPGQFVAYANVYLPRDATQVTAEVSAYPGLDLVEEEFGRPVVLDLLLAPPGETIHLDVSYVIPDAVERVGDGLLYRADLVPQPSLRPADVTVEIVLPAGAVIEETSAGLLDHGGAVVFEGDPTAPRTLWVRFIA